MCRCSPGAGKQSAQRVKSGQLETCQRTDNSSGLRRQIYRRLDSDETGPGHDLRTSGYWQDKASPLHGTTSGSNGERVPVDEHEFRHFSKNGLSGVGDVNYHLDQDHRQRMHRALSLRLVKDGLSPQSVGHGQIYDSESHGCLSSVGSSNVARL